MKTRKELMRLTRHQLVKACRNQGLGYGIDESKSALADRLSVSEAVEPEEKTPEEPEAPEESEAPPEVD